MIELGYLSVDCKWFKSSLEYTQAYRSIQLYEGVRILTIL